MVQKMIQFSKYELFYSAVSILKNNKYWFWGFDHTFVNIPLMTSGTSLNIPPDVSFDNILQTIWKNALSEALS